MKTAIFFFLTFLCASTWSYSNLTEIQSYDSVMSYVEKAIAETSAQDVLLVFDIDDTLLVTDPCLKADGTPAKGIGVFYICPSVHADNRLGGWISSLQERGLYPMALTARGMSLRKATERELARNHEQDTPYIFNRSNYWQDQELFVPKTKRCAKDEHSPCLSGEVSKIRFYSGVLYAQGANKGLALKQFLDEHPFRKVIFVDDRIKNIKNVQEVFDSVEEVELQAFLYLEHRD